MKEYITQQDVDEARESIPVNFGPIGNEIYSRTYARTKQNGEKEDWYETCQRVVNGNANLVDSVFIEKDEPKKLFDMMLKMEILPAGRHIYSSGIGKDYLFNCFQSDFTPDFVEHFYFTFMRLMEGGGVGANYSDLFVNSREKDKPWIPKAKINLHIVCQPDHNDYDIPVDIEVGEREWYGTNPTLKDFLSLKYSANWDPGISNGNTPEYIRVEDSREGWANALVRLLALSVNSDKERDYVVDISNIRPRGAILKGFGGKASGPDALVLLLDRTNRLFNGKIGKSLEGMDYMAIDHYIAMAVVSGGVRRSARMAMKYWKDPDIFDFITCKQAKPNEIPLHWTTNISVVIDNKFFRALKKNDDHAKKVYDSVVTNILNNGEPGFINASKAGEGEAPNSYFAGTNPCGEVAFFRYPDLYSFDLCCLGHVNLDRSKTPDESFRLVTRFLVRATFAKVSDERQKKNVERNRRIGVGFTGYHNWLSKKKIKFSDAPNKQEVVKFFQEMYSIVDKEAKKYCSDLRIVECIKKTTIAPVGTVSQLAGSTTGCQPVFSKFYIRRVRYSDTDDQLKELAERGYKIEKDMYAANTSVVEFICADPIYENTLNMLKAEYIQEGKTPEEAEALAKEEAIDLIEDQNEVKLEDFLANQRMLQKEYADNAISITINLDPGNTSVDEIKSVLRHYLPDLKGVTLFPEKGMPQSPYERLTYEKFLELSDQGKNFEVGQAEQECLNGACPIR